MTGAVYLLLFADVPYTHALVPLSGTVLVGDRTDEPIHLATASGTEFSSTGVVAASSSGVVEAATARGIVATRTTRVRVLNASSNGRLV